MSYTIQISNDKYENLVFSDQMITLELTEVIGNFLPMFSLTFTDNDFDKLSYLNEKSPVTIGYQLDERMISSQFMIKPVMPYFTESNYTCAIGGYLNVFNYFKGVPKVPYISGTSVEALKQLANAYFTNLDISPLETDDSMIWLHNGKNARNFMEDIWKHMYSPNSLPLIGITLDGTFKLYDVATLISQEPKYSFTSDMEDGYEMYVSVDVNDNNSGNTSLYGYTSEREIVLEDTMEKVISRVTPEVIMNTSVQMNEAEMPTRQLTPMFQSSNVHKHWYEAYHQNFIRWSSLNNNTLKMTVYNNLLPLGIMDLIYVKFPHLGQVGRTSDGNFIVSKKRMIFDNTGSVTTEYTAIREVSQSVNIATDDQSSSIDVYKI